MVNQRSRLPLRGLSVAVTMVLLALALPRAQTFDLVIANGRVLDPESNLDAPRWVGINGQTISAISPEPLTGRTTIDAAGDIVVPDSSTCTRTARRAASTRCGRATASRQHWSWKSEPATSTAGIASATADS